MDYCQSCGMPLDSDALCGTEQDGSRSKTYCCYCYAGGTFTWECTMEQMIDHCTRFVDRINDHAGTSLTREEAVERMRAYFPTLRRWAKP